MKESLNKAFPIIKNGPGISVDELVAGCMFKGVQLDSCTNQLIHFCTEMNACRFRGDIIQIQQETLPLFEFDNSYLEGSELIACGLTWENFRLRFLH